MHHGKHVRRLNRSSGHRNALLKNLVSSLIQYGRIETTVAKAKTIQPIADAMITLGKRGDIEAKKQAIAYLNSRDVTIPKLFEELAPRFANRQGGYTRIQRIGKRYGDNAPMAVIEYIDGPTDLKKETVTSVLARKFADTQKLSVKDILANEEKVKELGISKSLIRDLKKVQFSNSLEQIDAAIEKKMTEL
ncbi:ribosomal protein L17 [Rhizopus microsporus var. microsporus]|uniref:Ribosomal protein L17 n=2 Tax=Rhizopus microsporus TaxID=58291 RepID=A0A2G4STR1_RHIZD|nr:ribosomal protein L17 [Rhizopus microsporus ATCC 52813]ORE11569.1 ribosomal protein L17 [Rhizopus microsporus var. microsporus]PHZ12135.1 ribosomal protein L17 [Rhizopus microsporus ATCC 52813]